MESKLESELDRSFPKLTETISYASRWLTLKRSARICSEINKRRNLHSITRSGAMMATKLSRMGTLSQKKEVTTKIKSMFSTRSVSVCSTTLSTGITPAFSLTAKQVPAKVTPWSAMARIKESCRWQLTRSSKESKPTLTKIRAMRSYAWCARSTTRRSKTSWSQFRKDPTTVWRLESLRLSASSLTVWASML